MRDAIVQSTWDWGTFNVPERIALALADKGARVLHSEYPVSRFRRAGRPLEEIRTGVHCFGPEYLGAKLSAAPVIRNWQWRNVAEQLRSRAAESGLREPLFIYSHLEHMAPLCLDMKAHGFPLVHICMDYPEPYQYELMEISDRTIVIPKAVYAKLQAKYGEKIRWIPQSIHIGKAGAPRSSEPPDFASIPHPRLGYLGPIQTRLNLALLTEVLSQRPGWQFICFGGGEQLRLPNVHNMAWRSPEELAACVAAFDVAVMPYDCFVDRNLHCVPLKLFDYFLAGIPIVSTPVLAVAEFSNIVNLANTPDEFIRATEEALTEPPDSPKPELRVRAAHAHSTDALGARLEEVLNFDGAAIPESVPDGRLRDGLAGATPD
ncbi:MAG TPA: glycosyltransferase [Candidatus Aquilonibacter sp.]|nr:glycosyltransferase [Candidatus Aquilonibacter sp.]